MSRGKTKQISDSILGRHLALSVAANLARTKLVPEPLQVYDAQHLSEMLDLVGRALTNVAPLFVQDPNSGSARELLPHELLGAEVRRGATLLVLKDGRTLSSVSIRRADLRQAIAILKTVGIRGLNLPRDAAPAPRRPDGA